MELRRPRDWEREWLVDFANTETFTVGYIWGFALVAIWPLFLACGLRFFTAGELGACSVIGALGIVGVMSSIHRIRPVLAEARRSYREARDGDRGQRTMETAAR